MSRRQTVLLWFVGTASLITPASNYSPGREGYGLFLVLAAVAIPLILASPGRIAVRPLALATAALMAWSATTLVGSSPPSLRGAIIQLLLMVAAALVPALSVGADEGLEPLPMAACLARVVVITSTLSALREWSVTFPERLAMGVGGASVSPMVLLLCLGALMSSQPHRPRRLDRVVGCLAVILLVGTGSRIGLLLACALIGIVAHVRYRVRPSVLVGASALVVGALVALRGGVLIFDPARVESWARSLGIAWSHHSRARGAGLGSIFPWWSFEVQEVPLAREGQWRLTEQGRVLYHAHSVYVEAITELGLVGFVLLVVVLAPVVLSGVRVMTSGMPGRPLAAAVLMSLVAFGFETFIFHAFVATSVWWAMAWLLLLHERRRHSPALV